MLGASGMLEPGKLLLLLLLVVITSTSGTDMWLTSIWGSSAGANEVFAAHCEAAVVAAAGRLEGLVLG